VTVARRWSISVSSTRAIKWAKLPIALDLDPLFIGLLGALYMVVAGTAMFVPVARTFWGLDPAAALRAE